MFARPLSRRFELAIALLGEIKGGHHDTREY